MLNDKPVNRNTMPKDEEELARFMGAIAFSQFMMQRLLWGDMAQLDGSTVCLN